ncbi:MAG: hypothetical protein AAB303_04065 [Chloroflexota bacterium]
MLIIRQLAAVAAGRIVGDVTTLEDEASVEEVAGAYAELQKQMKMGSSRG